MATMPIPSPCSPWQGEQKMAKRSWPRSSKSSVRGKGKEFESLGTKKASVSSEPRATVFSIAGRSDRPSGKKSVGDRGFCRGWLAMSWRSVYSEQPATLNTQSARATAIVREEKLFFILHLADMLSVEALQKARGLGQIEFGIASLDAEEETVGRSPREAVNGKDRVIRLWQLVQCQHTDNGKNRSAKNGQFEGNGNEGRPAVEGAPADILGISNGSDPVLQAETTQTSTQAADKGDKRNPGTACTDGLGEAFDGKRSIRIDTLIAGFARFFGRRQELFRRLEFAHYAVKTGAVFRHDGSFLACPSCTSSRISAMAMAGNPRTNRKTSMLNSPKIVPARVA